MIDRSTPSTAPADAPPVGDPIYSRLLAAAVDGQGPLTFEGLVGLLGRELDVVSLRRGMKRLIADRWVDIAITYIDPQVFYFAEDRRRTTPADVWGQVEGTRLQYRPKRLSFADAGVRDSMQVALVGRDGYRCALCKETLPRYYRPEFDHIVPRSLGGPDDFDNRQLAHKSCNMAKSNKPDWRPSEPAMVWFDRVDGVWREVLLGEVG